MYAMLACLSAWSMSMLVRLLDDPAPSSRTVIAYAARHGDDAVHARVRILRTFGAQILFVSAAAIFQSRGTEARWKAAALAQALAFMLFLPWLPVFFVQVFHVQDSFWIPPVPAAELGRTLIAFAGGPMAVVLLPAGTFRRGQGPWLALDVVPADLGGSASARAVCRLGRVFTDIPDEVFDRGVCRVAAARRSRRDAAAVVAVERGRARGGGRPGGCADPR